MNKKRDNAPEDTPGGPSVRDGEVYEALRDEGASKEKAARIANAAAASSRSSVGRKGGRSGSYEDWTVERLRKRAAELDIDGRSKMNKDELITALRDH
ncbi:Rho termination factor N-terminal domain-containing protein [Corynebacterium pacaense]|uniref:Rho termination factor N-terminal domain-containing protein n=1 Tax=Corynebacterium pacaense TaxID=1816684 RepID=UPI001FE2B468|nr:Rho termination factor N-terminal domain-containing protein [Corynebacterium pacaense]